ncbi:MAG: GMC oxidoreductase [Verrucomicrobiota bacterium]
MSFKQDSYPGMISQGVETQHRHFPQYQGQKPDFEYIVIGSGMGGGIFADDLVDRTRDQKRILILEAGSYLYPTHVYNVSRIPNNVLARRFGSRTFEQGTFPQDPEKRQHYIHEELQLNFGGRSIFWSGLIPEVQKWELDFFPNAVANDLESRFLKLAGEKMNESQTLGNTAKQIVEELKKTDLENDFVIRETPRALHQPYINSDEFFIEPTGVFNTAELLINQVGVPHDKIDYEGKGLFMLLNHYVEDIQNNINNDYKLIVKDVLTREFKTFYARNVVLAAGSIGSPKLLKRSTIGRELPQNVQDLIGVGLTDHPTTDWVNTRVTKIGDFNIPRGSNAKITLYSKGARDVNNRVIFPFNIEMNVNHEYWHLRENDPDAEIPIPGAAGDSSLQIKFSFANCLDDGNRIRKAPDYQYRPYIEFQNLSWMSHLAEDRFPKVAGWDPNRPYDEIWSLLDSTAKRVIGKFKNDATVATTDDDIPHDKDFGWGTVHHSVGTLRMPYKPSIYSPVSQNSVVDEDLRVKGTQNLYVSDMSVLPFSSAANPVRHMAGLALRLSAKLAGD